MSASTFSKLSGGSMFTQLTPPPFRKLGMMSSIGNNSFICRGPLKKGGGVDKFAKYDEIEEEWNVINIKCRDFFWLEHSLSKFNEETQAVFCCGEDKLYAISLKTNKCEEICHYKPIEKKYALFIDDKIHIIGCRTHNIYNPDTRQMKLLHNLAKRDGQAQWFALGGFWLESKQIILTQSSLRKDNDEDNRTDFISKYSIEEDKWNHHKIDCCIGMSTQSCVMTKCENYLISMVPHTEYPDIMIYDINGNKVIKTTITSPIIYLRFFGTTAILRDDKRDENLAFGYVNENYEKFIKKSKMTTALKCPMVIMVMIRNYICNEMIHCMVWSSDEGCYHWKISVDDVLKSIK